MGYDIKNASNNIQEPLSALVSHGKVIKQKTYGGVIFKLNKPMNNDAIKAASEEYANSNAPTGFEPSYSFSFDVGAHWMQAQKDDQIKELVEGIEDHMNSVGGGKTKCGHDFDCVCAWNNLKQLIQKYKE